MLHPRSLEGFTKQLILKREMLAPMYLWALDNDMLLSDVVFDEIDLEYDWADRQDEDPNDWFILHLTPLAHSDYRLRFERAAPALPVLGG